MKGVDISVKAAKILITVFMLCDNGGRRDARIGASGDRPETRTETLLIHFASFAPAIISSTGHCRKQASSSTSLHSLGNVANTK